MGYATSKETKHGHRQTLQLYRRIVAPVAAALIILAHPLDARAATAGELLEKAIYAEAIVGDLDQAINRYEQVIAEGKQASQAAAQVQLRLGLCYQKSGKAAAAAFQAVVDRYPQESESVE